MLNCEILQEQQEKLRVLALMIANQLPQDPAQVRFVLDCLEELKLSPTSRARTRSVGVDPPGRV